MHILNNSANKLLEASFWNTSHLSPVAVKFFTLCMRNLVKPTESDEKNLVTLFTGEFQIFQLLQNFLEAKPIRFLSMSRGTHTAIKKLYKMAAPQLDQAKEKTDISNILKTGIIGLWISFRLRQILLD